MLFLHLDKAIEIDGKICVQVNEKDNPSPSYIYNDNGITRKIDGKEWKGDTEYSSIAGWMDEKSIENPILNQKRRQKKKIGESKIEVHDQEKER